MEIKWNATRAEYQIIRKIVDRAWKHDAFRSRYASRGDLEMDIEATHCNGNPLRLQDLLDGICRHLNRTTGELGGCFSPRFSKREAAAA